MVAIPNGLNTSFWDLTDPKNVCLKYILFQKSNIKNHVCRNLLGTHRFLLYKLGGFILILNIKEMT